MRNVDDTESLFGAAHAGLVHYQDIHRLEHESLLDSRWPLLSLFDAGAVGRIDVPSAAVKTPPPGPKPVLQAAAAMQRPLHPVPPAPAEGGAECIQPVVRREGDGRRPAGPASAAGGPLPMELLPALPVEGPPLFMVAVLGAKGGVGATTTTANLAAALGYGGLGVVALDLDPQNSLHPHFGLDPVGISGIARACLAEQGWSSQLCRAVPGRPLRDKAEFPVRVLPHGLLGESDSEEFGRYIGTHTGWLAGHLRDLQLPRGTVVLVDLPARAGVLTRQVLRMAHVAIGVTLADAASYVCLPQVERLVRTYCQPRPGFAGYRRLFNQIDHASGLGHDVARRLRQDRMGKVLGLVHRDQAVPEALACAMNVLDYDRHSQAALDFAACATSLAALLAGCASHDVRGTFAERQAA